MISGSFNGSALARVTWYKAAQFGHLKSRLRTGIMEQCIFNSAFIQK